MDERRGVQRGLGREIVGADGEGWCRFVMCSGKGAGCRVLRYAGRGGMNA